MKKSWLRRLLLSYLPVLILIVSLFVFVGIVQLNELSRKEAEKSNRMYVKNLQSTVEMSLRSIEMMMLEAISRNQVLTSYVAMQSDAKFILELSQTHWLNGKLGIWGSDNLEGGKGYGSFETFRKNNPDAEVVILPMPESSFGKFAPAGGTPMQFTAAINATAQNPEAVMAYVDWLMSEEVAYTLRYGFEGEHYTIGENGCPKPVDAEKNKKELNWNGDFQMLSNVGFMGKCAEFASSLDPSKPLDKEYLDLIAQGRAAYLTPERPLWKQFEFSPPLPSDMLVVTNTIKSTLTNIYTQAIIGGPNATVDKAIDEAMKAWEQAGGKRIDEFYASEFDKNKDNIINTNEYFKYIQ